MVVCGFFVFSTTATTVIYTYGPTLSRHDARPSCGPARPVETAAAEPAEPPQCATSRANIALLESESPVQQDTDGDGEPDRTLDDTERANQLNLARALLKANCPGGDAPAGK